jgi:V8-like Glu-specific endopeptidase
MSTDEYAADTPLSALPVLLGPVAAAPIRAGISERLISRVQHGGVRIQSVHADDDDGDGNADDRQLVNNAAIAPYKMICALHINVVLADGRPSWRVGTGFLIAPRIVVTAAHNVRNPTGWLARDFMITPGRKGEDSSASQSQMIAATAAECHPDWHRDGAFDWNHDIAVLQVARNFFAANSEFLSMREECADEEAIELSGYPLKIEGNPLAPASAVYPYRARGKVAHCEAQRLFYPLDSSGGQSGSPILARNAAGGPVAIGVHNLPIDASSGFAHSSEFNSATRLTADIIRWINSVT